MPNRTNVENFLKRLDIFHLFTKNPQEEYNEKQLDLQNQQFEYQKWYDQNNIQLKTQDAMKAGINPLVATNGNTSSVTASSQPQMPENNNAAAMSLLSDSIGKILDVKKHNDELKLAQDELQFEKDKHEDDEVYRDEYMAVLNARAGADVTRTEVYRQLAQIQGEESKTRQQSMAHDLLMRVKDSYGTQSSFFKKVFGELKHSLGDKINSVDDWLQNEVYPSLDGDNFKKSSKSPRPESKNYYDEYNYAVEHGGFKGSYEDYLKSAKGFKR